MSKKKAKVVVVRLDDDLLDGIDDFITGDETRSDVIRKSLRKFLWG